MKKIFPLFLILLLCACNKDEEEALAETSAASCSTNSGSFDITIGGATYEMALNSESQFTILYNWYTEETSDFVLNSVSQNNKEIYIELGLPGTFNEGETTYLSSDFGFDFFDIDVDTFNYYVSEVTFDVIESNLNSQDGTYTPVRATFNGTAHSYPWTNGQPPIDNLSFTGSFCLNGIILQ